MYVAHFFLNWTAKIQKSRIWGNTRSKSQLRRYISSTKVQSSCATYAVLSADPVLLMNSVINITVHVLEVNLISSLQEVFGDFHDIVINKMEKGLELVTYL